MSPKEYFTLKKDGEPLESIKIKGFADIFIYKKGELVERICNHNIVLNQGKKEIIEGLSTGTVKLLSRMSIGDRGALPSDRTRPKIPEASRTGLYAEIYRKDIEVLSTTTEGSTNEMLMVATFRAADVPITSYSDQNDPSVNEVGIIMADVITGAPLPRSSVFAPQVPPEDEVMVAMRTFKTVPFEAAQETAITIRYTLLLS